MGLRKGLSFAAIVAIAAGFTREARAQTVKLQATAPVKLQATAPAAPPPAPPAAPPPAPPPAAPAAPAPPVEGGTRLAVAFAQRGITNPEKILSPEADFNLTGIGGPFGVVGGISGIHANLALGAAYSLTDDLGVRATVIPIEFNSPTAFLGPSVGATYRLLKGDFELGVAADVLIQTCGSDSACYNPQYFSIGNNAGIFFNASAPMRLHFGKSAVLDTQPGLFFGGDGFGPVFGFAVPVQFAYDIVESVHVGVATGFRMDLAVPKNVRENQGNTVDVPLGLFGGYAMPGKEGPVFDLDAFFTWPEFLNGANTAEGGFFDFGLSFIYYLYL
jgi:hypothetical protein